MGFSLRFSLSFYVLSFPLNFSRVAVGSANSRLRDTPMGLPGLSLSLLFSINEKTVNSGSPCFAFSGSDISSGPSLLGISRISGIGGSVSPFYKGILLICGEVLFYVNPTFHYFDIHVPQSKSFICFLQVYHHFYRIFLL